MTIYNEYKKEYYSENKHTLKHQQVLSKLIDHETIPYIYFWKSF